MYVYKFILPDWPHQISFLFMTRVKKMRRIIIENKEKLSRRDEYYVSFV